tara:strand:+ start:125 stop:250 length:126 start_codon:yes stop_codon:yes gene_type:complete
MVGPQAAGAFLHPENAAKLPVFLSNIKSGVDELAEMMLIYE